MDDRSSNQASSVTKSYDQLPATEKRVVFQHIVERFEALEMGAFPAGLRDQILELVPGADNPAADRSATDRTGSPFRVPDACTDRVRTILRFANTWAQELNSSDIGTAHLLGGLLEEARTRRDGNAAKIFSSLGTDPKSVSRDLELLIGRGSGDFDGNNLLPYSEGFQNALARACDWSGTMGKSYVGTEHILLSLLEEEKGIAHDILKHHSLTLETVRNLISMNIK